MDIPKVRSVVSDPSQPDGDRLVLLRMSEKGAQMLSSRFQHALCKES